MDLGVINDCPSLFFVCRQPLSLSLGYRTDIGIRRFILQKHYSLSDAILGKYSTDVGAEQIC